MVQIVKLIGQGLNNTVVTGGLVPKGAYAAGTDYAVGDSVDYQGSSYVMHTDAAAGTVPTNTTYWQVLANKGDTGPNEVTTSTTTDITGLLKGDGANVAQAVSGTDYQGVLAEGAFANGDKTKLDGIEASADVTDTANVTAAGALMDSEVTNLAQVKAFDSTDYATAAQGATADTALQDITGENLTDLADVTITTPSNGQVLKYNGTVWINDTDASGGSPAWGDITGTLANQTDLQSALDGKSGTAHTHLLAAGATDVTASAAELNTLDGITATTTELNYTDGVTSAIQTQIDAKADDADLASYLPLSGGTLTGKVGLGIAPVSQLHVYQNTTDTGNGVGLTIEQDGTGDASFQFLLTAVRRWAVGVDNSDNDSFKMSPSADVGSNPVFALTTGGTLSVQHTLPRTSATYDLGSSSFYWANLYATRHYLNSTADFNGSTAGVITTTGDLRVTTAGINSASVVTVGGTQTLSNKTFTGTTTLAASTFNGTITSRSIQPSVNLTYNLGSSFFYFTDAYSQTVHLNSTARIAGTTSGQLRATGDIAIQSPDATWWKITVDNTGAISTSAA